MLQWTMSQMVIPMTIRMAMTSTQRMIAKMTTIQMMTMMTATMIMSLKQRNKGSAAMMMMSLRRQNQAKRHEMAFVCPGIGAGAVNER